MPTGGKRKADKSFRFVRFFLWVASAQIKKTEVLGKGMPNGFTKALALSQNSIGFMQR